MEQEKKAERVVQTLTGPWEKKALVKMAQSLPSWANPDHLTVLGIVASFIIFSGFILIRASPWWVMLSDAGFVIHWWADSLDGTLARVRHREREKYGYFVDHICDAFSTALICTGLGLSPLAHLAVGMSLAIGYLLMNILTHVEAYVERIFKISYGRFGPTEVRIVFMLVTTIMAFWNPVILRVSNTEFTLTDCIASAVTLIFLLVFSVSSLRTAVRLDRADRTKWIL